MCRSLRPPIYMQLNDVSCPSAPRPTGEASYSRPAESEGIHARFVSVRSTEKRISIAHIVPSLVIGGVEVAIAKSFNALREQLDYGVYYVKTPGPLQLEQKSVWKLLFDLVMRRQKIHVVVTSLWAAHPFGFLAKCMGAKWVVFFHSSGISHRLERFVFSIAWQRSDMRLVDSIECGTSMANLFGYRQWHVINYLFPIASKQKSWGNRNIDVIFVGRAASVKRLDLVVALVNAYATLQYGFHAIFAISGSPPECVNNLAKLYPASVDILINVSNTEVQELLANSRFYVLLSDYEGFSMATAEAVLAGAVPVVRPVGEVVRYVTADSGIRVTDISEAGLISVASEMSALMTQADKAEQMTLKGREKLLQLYEPYVDSFVQRMHEAAS